MDQSLHDSSCLVSTYGSVHLLFLPRQYMKRTKMDTEDEFEEEAEENLSVRAWRPRMSRLYELLARKEVLAGAQSQKLNTDTIFYHSIVWANSDHSCRV